MANCMNQMMSKPTFCEFLQCKKWRRDPWGLPTSRGPISPPSQTKHKTSFVLHLKISGIYAQKWPQAKKWSPPPSHTKTLSKSLIFLCNKSNNVSTIFHSSHSNIFVHTLLQSVNNSFVQIICCRCSKISTTFVTENCKYWVSNIRPE